jgi:hypothetical protein
MCLCHAQSDLYADAYRCCGTVMDMEFIRWTQSSKDSSTADVADGRCRSNMRNMMRLVDWKDGLEQEIDGRRQKSLNHTGSCLKWPKNKGDGPVCAAGHLGCRTLFARLRALLDPHGRLRLDHPAVIQLTSSTSEFDLVGPDSAPWRPDFHLVLI